MPKRLSEANKRALQAALDHGTAAAALTMNNRRGGAFWRMVEAMRREGLFDQSNAITAAGRDALASGTYEPRTARRFMPADGRQVLPADVVEALAAEPGLAGAVVNTVTKVRIVKALRWGREAARALSMAMATDNDPAAAGIWQARADKIAMALMLAGDL